MALPTILILGLIASSIPAIICGVLSHANEVSDASTDNENYTIIGENGTLVIPIGNLRPTGSITEMSYRGKVIIKKFTCPAIYGRYPHPESCEYYFECRFGWPTLWHCNKGYLYDVKKEQCRDKRSVKCHIGGHDRDHNHRDGKDKEIDVKDVGYFKCPYIWGTFAHPYDCSKYYVCVYNYPKLFQCYQNFLYDTHYRKCLPSQRVKCGDRLDRDQMRTSRRPVSVTTTVKPVEITTLSPKITKGNFYCPFPYGRYPDPEDCSRFYECRFSIPHLHTCPESTLYDERKEQCLDMKSVKCGGRPGGNDEDVTSEDNKNVNFRCPYVWGTFAHPVDCSKYIVCIYNVPSIFNCRKNELFDAHYRRCLPKERVSCNDRIDPDDQFPFGKTTASPVVSTLTPSTAKKFPKPTTTSLSTTRSTTTTPVPTTTTTTPVPTTTPFPTTATNTPVPTTTTTTPDRTTTPVPTTTTTTPVPTTTPVLTTQTTTYIPTTITTSPSPTTITNTPVPVTTTTTPISTTLSTRPTVSSKPTTVGKPSTIVPVTKPNTPPPTDCAEDDLDCIIDDTGDVTGWFDCPKRYGHFPHGSSKQLFIHCDNWRPFVKKCAEHTQFSPIYLVCVWENKKQSV